MFVGNLFQARGVAMAKVWSPSEEWVHETATDSVWQVLLERMYWTKISSLDEMKQRLQEEWA